MTFRPQLANQSPNLNESESNPVVDPTVSDIMRTDVPTVSPVDSIATVARLIAVSGLPGVPVVENGEIIGIITESDIVFRRPATGLPPAKAGFLIGKAVRSDMQAGQPFQPSDVLVAA